jgi:hypothetical protein
MQFYGLLGSARSCSITGAVGAGACGVPVRQRDANGSDTAYYVSTTSWHRPGALESDQSGFPDARYVPYLVFDSAKFKPFGVELGDLALIAWRGHATFAVYGDSGNHLCEGSLATHNRLYGKPDAAWVDWSTLGVPSGARVIAFPHSAHFLAQFPQNTQSGPSPGALLYKAGSDALDALGGDKLLPLVGLSNRDSIARN